MRRNQLFFITGFLLCLTACTGNKQAIQSKELRGRYEVDFAPLTSALSETEDDFAAALASLFLSSMELTMQFDDDRLIIDANDAARRLLTAFGGKETVIPLALDYKIQNDSVLCTRSQGNDFQPIGILRKMGNTYDYLTFDLKPVSLTLRKITEKP